MHPSILRRSIQIHTGIMSCEDALHRRRCRRKKTGEHLMWGDEEDVTILLVPRPSDSRGSGSICSSLGQSLHWEPEQGTDHMDVTIPTEPKYTGLKTSVGNREQTEDAQVFWVGVGGTRLGVTDGLNNKAHWNKACLQDLGTTFSSSTFMYLLGHSHLHRQTYLLTIRFFALNVCFRHEMYISLFHNNAFRKKKKDCRMEAQDDRTQASFWCMN